MERVELGSRILIELGVWRGREIAIGGVAGVAFGAPSALNWTDTPGAGPFFANQDWVWGVGLMLSGFFFAFAVLRYGVTEWRAKHINTADSDIHVGAWWDWTIRLVIVESVVLMGWLLLQARGESFRATWTLFSPFNIGTVLIQFAIAIVLLRLLNSWLVRRLSAPDLQ